LFIWLADHLIHRDGELSLFPGRLILSGAADTFRGWRIMFIPVFDDICSPGWLVIDNLYSPLGN
jgi:hypothetical protein